MTWCYLCNTLLLYQTQLYWLPWIIFLCHHIAHIEKRWVTHWRSQEEGASKYIRPSTGTIQAKNLANLPPRQVGKATNKWVRRLLLYNLYSTIHITLAQANDICALRKGRHIYPLAWHHIHTIQFCTIKRIDCHSHGSCHRRCHHNLTANIAYVELWAISYTTEPLSVAAYTSITCSPCGKQTTGSLWTTAKLKI